MYYDRWTIGFYNSCQTLCFSLEAAPNSRGDPDALFRRTGTRGLARLAGFSRAGCSDIAARGQQTPPVHLFQPAIPSAPGENARSGTPQCTLAALARKNLYDSRHPATGRTLPPLL